ncbi:uncharacterized protein [Clytia hemisphaerica]|uniref:Activin types I and II receptor domain-containing protein n=1 Tax=Clytia hemisphaerica TaxID=252671 RepID=A0A7M5VB79_9CNID
MGVKVLVCFMLIAVTCRYSFAIKCNVPQVPGMAMDCADKEMGTFHEDVCMVQVMGTSNASQVTSGCMGKQAPLSSCGTNMNVGDKNIKLCCCKSDQCNDDAFIKACREGTAPTSHPPAFSCYMSVQMGVNTDDEPVSGSMACSTSNEPMLNKCMYMKVVTNNQTVIRKSCVPDDGAAINQCGQKMNMGGQQMISCCCDGSNCNDDTFAAKCLGENDAGNPPLVVGTTAAAPQTTAPTQEPTAKETTTRMQADADYSPGSASTEKVSCIILALSVIFYALMS